jgi:dsRNA-specific ribonuclease
MIKLILPIIGGWLILTSVLSANQVVQPLPKLEDPAVAFEKMKEKLQPWSSEKGLPTTFYRIVLNTGLSKTKRTIISHFGRSRRLPSIWGLTKRKN